MASDNGLFLSTNRGVSWSDTARFSGTISGFCAGSSELLYVATQIDQYVGKLFRSTNGGHSWVELPWSSHVSDMKVSPSGELFIMAYGHMARSNDSGSTYIPLTGSFPEPWFRSVGFSRNGVIIVGGIWGYIYRSTNNGVTWSTQHLGNSFSPDVNTVTTAKDGRIYVSNVLGRLFISGDEGASWYWSNYPFDTPAKTVVSELGHIYSGGYNAVAWSTNDGSTWEPLHGGLTNTSLSGLALDSSGFLYLANTTGLYRSTNHTGPKITITGPNGGEVITAYTTTTITWNYFFMPNMRIDYSTDAGETWLPIARNIPAANRSYVWNVPNTPSVQCRIRLSGEVNPGAYDISDSNFIIRPREFTVIKPNGGEQLPIGLPDTIKWANPYQLPASIQYSVDYGSSWSTLAASVSPTDSMLLWTVPDIPSSVCKIRIFSQADSLVGDSSDNLFLISTWQKLSGSIPLGICNAILQLPAGKLMVGSSTGIYVSSDDGSSWSLSNSGITTNDVKTLTLLPGGSIMAGTWGGGIFRSTDGGGTWTPFGLAGTRTVALSVNGSTLLAGTFGGGVYISTNSGSSWIQRNTGLGSLSVTAVIQSSSYIFAATQSGGLFRSSNLGIAWSRVGNLSGLTSDFIMALKITSNGLLLAGTSQGIFRSTDGGGNVWTRIAFTSGQPTEWVYSIGANNSSTVFAGAEKSVYQSDDNGSSWRPIGISAALGLSIQGNKVIAVAGGVYRSRNILPLTLTSPVGGEVLMRREVFNITWLKKHANFVNLDLSTDNGSTWQEVEDQIPAQSGSFAWTVPVIASAQCRIRVSDANKPEYFYTSDSAFSILNPPPPPGLLVSPVNAAKDVPLLTTLTWQRIESIDQLQLQIAVDSNFSSIRKDTLINPFAITYSTYTLNYGTRYFWRIRGQNSAGWGAWSTAWYFTTVIAQFSPTTINLATVSNSSVAWCDYDLDGDLDLALAGSNTTRLYKNNGNGSFAEHTGTGIAGVDAAGLAWGDMNNDGYPDLAVAGYSNSAGRLLKVYINTAGTFSELTGQGLTGADDASLVWVDYNNDGWQDLFITGTAGLNQPVIKLYRNMNGTRLIVSSLNLPALDMGFAAWADYNNDSYQDVVLSGSSGTSFITALFQNNRNGDFIPVATGQFTGARAGSATWVDYNSDGNPDLLISGQDSVFSGFVKLYKNIGNGQFVLEPNIPFPALIYGSSSWGDVNNDGLYDVALMGTVAGFGNSYGGIFKNEGTASFSLMPHATIANATRGKLAWADFDSDGDLDIVQSGVTKVYRNQGTTVNTLPAPPSILQASITSGKTLLQWQPGSDVETPTAGLQYEIYVGTRIGVGDVVAPMSEINTGKRRIAQRGNLSALMFELGDLPPGKYYWSVQSVDAALAGSPFAPPDSFTIYAMPATPTLMLPLNSSIRQRVPVRFSWLKAANAESYAIQISNAADFSTLVLADSSISDTTYLVSGLHPLRTYYWRVRGSNVGLRGSYSVPFSFRTLGVPYAVQLLSPAQNAINLPVSRVQFIWQKAIEQKVAPRALLPTEDAGADGLGVSFYCLEITTDTTGVAIFFRDSTITDTSLIINGFTNSQRYFWRVAGNNELGWGDYSAWRPFTTMPARPSPVSLAAPANASNGLLLPITFKWLHAARAEKYTLEISDSPSFASLIFRDSLVQDTSAVISALPLGRSYYWRVVATSQWGVGDTSGYWNFSLASTPGRVALAYPLNNAGNVHPVVNCIWQSVPSTYGTPVYWFELATDSLAQPLLRDTTLADTVKHLSLSHATRYFWRIKAANVAGWGNFSYWRVFTTIVPIPASPNLVTPGNNAKKVPLTVQLIWNGVNYAQYYHLQLSADSLFSHLAINDTACTDTLRLTDSLQFRTSYFWRVKCSNLAGSSGFSPAYVFTTSPRQLPAPDNLTAVNSTIGKVRLLWRDNSNDETGFVIIRKIGDSTSSHPGVSIDTLPANTSAYYDTTVVPGTTYSYRVLAVNSDTLSWFSNYATVSTITSIATELHEVPSKFILLSAYPNPCNPAFVFTYGLPRPALVSIVLYNLTGQLVKQVLTAEQSEGFHTLTVQMGQLPSGMYYCVVRAAEVGNQVVYYGTNKVMLLK